MKAADDLHPSCVRAPYFGKPARDPKGACDTPRLEIRISHKINVCILELTMDVPQRITRRRGEFLKIRRQTGLIQDFRERATANDFSLTDSMLLYLTAVTIGPK